MKVFLAAVAAAALVAACGNGNFYNYPGNNGPWVAGQSPYAKTVNAPRPGRI